MREIVKDYLHQVTDLNSFCPDREKIYCFVCAGKLHKIGVIHINYQPVYIPIVLSDTLMHYDNLSQFMGLELKQVISYLVNDRERVFEFDSLDEALEWYKNF